MMGGVKPRTPSALRVPRVVATAVAAAAVSVMALFGAGCAPEPDPEPVVLTTTEAGSVYLDAVCPVNSAWDEADLEIDRLRIAIERGEADTTAFASAMTELSEAHTAAAEALQPEDSTWPSGAQDEVAAVQKSLLGDGEEALEVAELSAEKVTTYSWRGAKQAAATGAAAREVLGITEDPVTACELHAESKLETETDAEAETHP